MYASNGNVTIETQPTEAIITDRFGIAVHLSPADAAWLADQFAPKDTQAG
jgi:hypothetical protein